ncbi:MAG: Ig-like domain-containing protein [Sedimentitalea sp.]
MTTATQFFNTATQMKSDTALALSLSGTFGDIMTGLEQAFETPGRAATALDVAATAGDFPDTLVRALGLIPKIGTIVREIAKTTDNAAETLKKLADRLDKIDDSLFWHQQAIEKINEYNDVVEGQINILDVEAGRLLEDATLLNDALGTKQLYSTSRLNEKFEAYAAQSAGWLGTRDAVLGRIDATMTAVETKIAAFKAAMPEVGDIEAASVLFTDVLAPITSTMQGINNQLCRNFSITLFPATFFSDAVKYTLNICDIAAKIGDLGAIVQNFVAGVVDDVLDAFGINIANPFSLLANQLLAPFNAVKDQIEALETSVLSNIDLIRTDFATLQNDLISAYFGLFDPAKFDLFENSDSGTNLDDTRQGTNLEDGLFGLGGNDLLSGLGGNDFLFGGAGDDEIFGGTGNDELYGGSGRDELFGQDNNDLLEGEGDDDILNGGGGDDILLGGDGADTLSGGDGNDLLEAGGGVSNDVLMGDAGDDVLRPGFGVDRMTGGTGADQFRGTIFDLSQDVITDFTTLDRIVVEGISFNSLLITHETGQTRLGVDTNGDGQPGTTVFLEGDYTSRDFFGEAIGSDIWVSLVSETAPNANDDTINLSENGTTTWFVLNNDSDDEGDELVITAVNGQAANIGQTVFGQYGQLKLFDDGGLVYEADQADRLQVGVVVNDTFTYTISDGTPASTSTATIRFNITGVNDAPELQTTQPPDQFVVFGEAFSLYVGQINGVFSDVDNNVFASIDNNRLSYSATLADGSPLPSWLSVDGANLVGTPSAADAGLIEVTLMATDPHGATAERDIFINVGGPVNSKPTPMDDSGVGFTIDEDSPFFFTASVLANDTDPDLFEAAEVIRINGERVRLLDGGVDLPSGGVVGLDRNGVLVYGQDEQFQGLSEGETATDTFSYHIRDSRGATQNADVTITITGVNDGPVAEDDAGAGFVGTEAFDFITASLLANDSDADTNDTFSITQLDGRDAVVNAQIVLDSGALVTLLADGRLHYDPNGAFDALASGEIATETIDYEITDGFGASDTASVSIRVDGLDTDQITAPVIDGDLSAKMRDRRAELTGEVSLLRGDGQRFETFEAKTTTTEDGTFRLDSEGTWTFQADPTAVLGLQVGESRVVSYGVAAADGSATDTVEITINGSNQAPGTTGRIRVGTTEDAPLDLDVSSLGFDPDATDTALTFSINRVIGDLDVTRIDDTTFRIVSNDALNALGDGQTATARVLFDVTDAAGVTTLASSGAGQVFVTITGANDAPIAQNAVRLVTDGQQITGSFAPLISDIDSGDAVGVVLGGDITAFDTDLRGTFGVLSVAADGTYRYVADDPDLALFTGESGTDTFTYQVADQLGLSTTATLSFDVTGTGREITGSASDDTLTGGIRDDLIDGRAGSDTLIGRGGNDILLGRDGDDLLIGGTGGDQFSGGGGSDTVSYADAAGPVHVDPNKAASNQGEAAGDTYKSIENVIGSGFDDVLRATNGDNILTGRQGDDVLQGRQGDDVLIGSGGHDTLNGGGGNDRLVGGNGRDTYIGGAGADVLVFGPGGTPGEDIILDFADTGSATDDLIDLSAFSLAFGDIAVSVSGNDAVIALGGGASIRLDDYLTAHALSDLQADDFLLS